MKRLFLSMNRFIPWNLAQEYKLSTVIWLRWMRISDTVPPFLHDCHQVSKWPPLVSFIHPTKSSLVWPVGRFGLIAHLVSPNKIHYAYIADWKKRYPEGLIAWSSTGVEERQPSRKYQSLLMKADEWGSSLGGSDRSVDFQGKYSYWGSCAFS